MQGYCKVQQSAPERAGAGTAESVRDIDSGLDIGGAVGYGHVAGCVKGWEELVTFNGKD